MLRRLLPHVALIVAAQAAEVETLPRVPATESDRAAATLKVRPGFRMDLVASEPLVSSPVAMAFDELGRLYVVEMRDYSERRPERLGRVRRLEDTDGDGRMDKATVFLDGLAWPTAITCWRGGVFIGSTPDIFYARDNDGDGVADVRELVFTGFASDYAPYETNRLNVQALMNSFQWGIDNRIHGSASVSGGKVKLADSAFVQKWTGRTDAGKIVDVRGRDFSFDPRMLELRAETGGAQHGMTFDDTGEKFVCSNSDHLQWVAYDAEGVPPNPFYPLPSPRLSIAADGGAAEVFRISPDEPWRVVRTRWRVTGVEPGMIEGGGRPSGYFTGATGTTVHRGDHAADAAGDVFVADCGSNLIHRKRLHRDGFALEGARVADEVRSEFVASTDNWFRPVQFANAPDGCLWVIDMYREVIEHPWSLPEPLKRQLDLDSGRDRGRLWRIAPDGFSTARDRLSFAGASTDALVALLAHPNGWHRDTASRLLTERGTRDALPLLEKTLASTSAHARLHALNLLQALGGLTADRLALGLADTSAQVRRQAVRQLRLSGLRDAKTTEVLQTLAVGETDATVLWEIALAAESLPKSVRTEFCVKHAQNQSSWVRSAALYATRGIELEVFESLAAVPSSDQRNDALKTLAGIVAKTGEGDALDRVLSVQADKLPDSLRFGIGSAILEGVGAGESALAKLNGRDSWKALVESATGRVRSGQPGATAALGLLPAVPDGVDLLVSQLSSAANPGTRNAALAVLRRTSESRVTPKLLAAWSGISTEARAAAVGLAIRRTDGAKSLLAEIERGRINANDIDLSSVAALRDSSDTDVRKRARAIFGEPPPARTAVVASMLPALTLKGDAVRGGKVFTDRCATCHTAPAGGVATAPDLASVRSNGKEKLLVSILDPNREVAPSFVAWSAENSDGETVDGVLAREDATAVVLRQAGGIETRIERARLKRLTRSDRSLMPEGLESGLTAQDFADLLEFVVAPR